MLPNCKTKSGFTPIAGYPVPDECQRYAKDKELCVTHAGAVLLNQAAATPIAINIAPRNASMYWAQLFTVAVFDTGVQTSVFNGQVVDVVVKGSSQFASTNVPLIGFSAEMPFLGVAWDMADATNPIEITVNARAAGNIDIHVFTTGYGIR
jgi:hypothetical protein